MAYNGHERPRGTLKYRCPAVHVAFATLLAKAPRWEGTLGHTRLSPIAKALQRQLSG